MDDVLGGKRFRVVQGDCLEVMRGLPDGCVSLCFFSPPYTGARLYLENGENLGVVRDAEQWAAWMVEVFRECVRVCTGLVACVCDDQTSGYRYGCAPYLLMADLARAGFNLRRPCVYRRSGIPGSGGPDWFRCDHEPIICVTRPGRLPWSEVTACGHVPKWAPGGEMSHRLSDGSRVNEWGGSGKNTFRMADGTTKRQNGRVSRPGTHTKAEIEGRTPTDPGVDVFGEPLPEPETTRSPHGVDRTRPDGSRPKGDKGKGDNAGSENYRARKSHTKAKQDGDETQSYAPPVLANPGTVVQRHYTAEEVAALLGEQSDTIDCVVGSGQMGEGDRFSRQNDAPFPEELAERFVRSFAPPDSIVLDPFSGSGTTAAVAVRWNRRALAIDLRQSQVDLTLRRLDTETPLALFSEVVP